MDGRVMVVCDGFAEDFIGDAVPGSYLVSVELRANGGALVLWSDEPDQAMVFDDVAAASEFCRDGPLALFKVSFVLAAGPPIAQPGQRPAPPPRHVESEPDFLKRLSRIRSEAEARQAAALITPSEADELRAMGLM